jgi:hypothetical protein
VSELRQGEFHLTPAGADKPEVWVPDDGWHLFTVRIQAAAFEGIGREKPFVNVTACVTLGPHAGLVFTFRVYLHQAAENWLKYFLKKFEYPAALLEEDPPKIKLSAIIGTEGQLLVLVSQEDDLKTFDVKGFGHTADADLEARFAGMRMREQASAEEPAVDIHEDVRGAEVPPSDSYAVGYAATDADLPANMFSGGPTPEKEEDAWPD